MKTKKRTRTKNKKKVIVFDLDETIGHFEELGRFIDGLASFHENGWFIKSYKKNAFDNITENYFDALLDLYPEFFRNGIFSVFQNLIKEKKKNKHLKVIIYTNNMGPRSWTLYIKKYIEKKIKHKLFDKIITGFHTNITKCRTTYKKTYDDLIKCASISKKIPILFIDDQSHENMKHKNVTYIQIYPYKISIKFDEMTKRFLKKQSAFKEHFRFISNVSKREFILNMKEILSKMGESYVTYKAAKTHINKKDKHELYKIKKNIKKFIQKGTRKKYKKKLNKTHKFRKLKSP